MRYVTIAAALMLTAGPAFAQQTMDHGKMTGMKEMPAMGHGQMSGMDHGAMAKMMAGNPYGRAEMDMHMKMMSAKQGDASEMWTRKMIEHHRGAIAMARVAQQEAKDSEIRQMADITITKQEKDISEMQSWLSKHGKRPQ